MASPFCSHPSGSGNNANASVTFTATSGSDVAAVNSNAPLASGQPQASPHRMHYVTGGGACAPTNGVQLGPVGSELGCVGAVQSSDLTASYRSLTPAVSLARGTPQAIFGQPRVAPPTSASGATDTRASALAQGPAFASTSGFAPGPQPQAIFGQPQVAPPLSATGTAPAGVYASLHGPIYAGSSAYGKERQCHAVLLLPRGCSSLRSHPLND